MTSNLTIRDACIEDAQGIAEVHVQSWRETYAGIVSDSHLNSLDPVKRAKIWKDRFLDPKYDGQVFVAEIDKKIIGFSGVGPSRSDEYSNCGEVLAIYLLREFKNRGIGKLLFEAGQKHLADMGFQKFFCWVLKDNLTRGFYENVGGRLSNYEKIIKIGEQELLEVAYEWEIK